VDSCRRGTPGVGTSGPRPTNTGVRRYAVECSHRPMTLTRPTLAAAMGGLCLVPFLAVNAIVGNRLEPFFSLIRPGPHTSTREYVLLAVLLLLIPGGAVIAARPMLRKDDRGGRRLYAINATVAALLGLVFIVLSLALGSDIYRCDVLGVPNCD
jgi:hypothetical protein